MTDSSDAPAPFPATGSATDFLKSIRTAAWKTAGARYNAARRLARRELFGVVSMALFSVGTVGIAFVQRVYTAPGSQTDNYLTTTSAILGVLLLAVSLTEWGARNGAKSDDLHRNAEALNAFQRKVELRIAEVEASQRAAWDVAEEVRKEYEQIKGECATNHQPIDFELVAASRRTEPEFVRYGKPTISVPQAAVVWFRWTWSSLWFFLLLWVIFSIALAGAFFVANLE